MKKLFSIALCSFAFFTTSLGVVQANNAVIDMATCNSHTINHRALNILLAMASDYLSISHGQARQMYHHQQITIKEFEMNGSTYFDVSLDGMCIILVLEDAL